MTRPLLFFWNTNSKSLNQIQLPICVSLNAIVHEPHVQLFLNKVITGLIDLSKDILAT